MRGRTAFALLLGVALSLWLAVPTASAEVTFCLPGSGLGQCNGPQGVAVDSETGHVYVADRGNNRVNIFESDGTPIGSFNDGLSSPAWIGVDNDPTSTSRHSIYVSTNSSDFLIKKFVPNGVTANYIEAESFGKVGTGACQFAANGAIAIGPDGDVYVSDSYEKGDQTFFNRIIVFDSSGACKEEIPMAPAPLFEGESQRIRNFTVDSDGNLYVTVAGAGGVLRKYDPAGTLLYELDKGTETEGLAVDSADNVFAKQRGKRLADGNVRLDLFTEYSSSGATLRRFGYVVASVLNVPALAAYSSSAGDLYASEGSLGIKYLDFPPLGPVVLPVSCAVKAGGLGSASATLLAEVNPEGKATTFHFEYLTQVKYNEEGGFAGFKKTDETLLPGTADFNLHEAAVKIEGLDPEVQYRCRVVAQNADGQALAGPEGAFTTREGFEFGAAWASEVNETTATVSAEGNPLGSEAKGVIEYVTEAQYQANEFTEARKAPPGELDYGAGEEMQLRSAILTDLLPGTVYHWRLRALNGNPPEGIVCPKAQLPPCPENEHIFRTYIGEASGADGRGYELVSPSEKNSAEVAVPGIAAGVFEDRTVRIQASSGSGDAVTYTSFTSFGEADGAPATSQYLSKRSHDSWRTENISPFGFQTIIAVPPFSGFTPELRFGVFKVLRPALAPNCPEDFENLYFRDNSGQGVLCLTPESPVAPSTTGCTFVYAGSSADGSRVFFASGASYAGAPAGQGFNLYEWSKENGLQAVSILPGETTPAEPAGRTSFAGRGAASISANCQVGQSILRHAISADGSRAIWTFAPEALASITPVADGIYTLSIAHATGGTFTLSFEEKTTTPIDFNASAGTVQAALESLSSVGLSNVEVTGSGPYMVTFKGALSGTDSQLVANGNSLVDVASRLLVRVNGSETIQLDAKQSGSGESGNGIFWAASADGSVIYFTDENRLVSGAKSEAEKPDLYRYDFANPTAPLTNLTKSSTLLPGEVRGVVGTSDDGSHVYFVARAVLTAEEENSAGLKAQAGENNLYLFHEGKIAFIATLAPVDAEVWGSQPKGLTARVSPDGRHLAFLSIEAKDLAAYDNTIATGEHCEYNFDKRELGGGPLCAQAFLYDAESAGLTCISCNPSGSRPLGPTLLPGWTNPYEGPRFLSDDGSRFFFESFDRLVQADESPRRDIYEFERSGTGSCSPANPNFDAVTGGCLFLLSSGRSSDETFLVDASSDGRDVFFSTRSPLVEWADGNQNFDIYDYRVGGGFPPPPPLPPVCSGEGCKPPASPQPPPPTPITPGFIGPGNVTPKKKQQQKKKQKKQAKKKQHKKRGAGR